MPLDEREQRILEEIERHLYEEDPKLAQKVKATLGSRSRRRQRLAVLGFVVGLVVMLGSFTSSAVIAGLGFILMVASAGWLAMMVRSGRGDGAQGGAAEGWLDRLRDRWRRGR